MTQDVRQSLTALGSVLAFIGLFAALLHFGKGIDIPEWVVPLGLGLMTIDVGWSLLRWARARHIASRD
jgi:dipeptide/tripeptide permease